jgi:hypothetical protein
MKKWTLFFIFLAMSQWMYGQEEADLLDLLGEEEPATDYVTAAFKTSRVINGQSIENTAAGVLDVKISHRFGFLNTGFYELFGLDAATIRIGGDYGITEWLMVGVGRSSFEKTYDGFLKARILRQSTGAKHMPVSLSYVAGMAITTLRFQNPDRENYFSSRLFYTHQLLLTRKFSDGFTLQLMPTLVHRNLVRWSYEENDVLSLGIAVRQKLSKRITINVEYYHVFDDQLAPGYRSPLSIGFDIETGGHVFQLHFTNATSMIEKGFIGETIGNWADGDIHFGFNISRVFTLVRPKIQ